MSEVPLNPQHQVMNRLVCNLPTMRLDARQLSVARRLRLDRKRASVQTPIVLHHPAKFAKRNVRR